jgi:hypothetical protein
VKKAADLLAWYSTNRDSLMVYHSYAMDSVQAWKDHFWDFNCLLETIDAYAATSDRWKLGNFGRSNKTWVRFLDWCMKTCHIGRPSPAYLWFSTSFFGGHSQDGSRRSLNLPLPRSHTTKLCSTMKMHRRRPLTMA